MISVVPDWISGLSLQKQAVLLMALRGPDGFAKMHACKPILWFYRACVIKAAHKGRMLRNGEHVGSLMTLRGFLGDDWHKAVKDFESVVDELPLHYFTHLMHGVQVLAFECPDIAMRHQWAKFYLVCCDYLHVPPESEHSYNKRLGDFGRPLNEVLEYT